MMWFDEVSGCCNIFGVIVGIIFNTSRNIFQPELINHILQ